MVYRMATKNDYEYIIAMKERVKRRVVEQNLPIWQNGYPTNDMIEEDINCNEARVIEENGKIIAYAAFYHAEKDYGKGVFLKDNLQCFGRLMVDDGYVGKHVGDYLVQQLISEARTLPVDGMGVLVDDCNLKAVNLYKKHGFKKESERQFPYAYLSVLGLYF